jgi:penicillin-binding protein 1A
MQKDGVKEDEIRKSFDVKTNMKVFAWNTKRETDTVMTPLDSIIQSPNVASWFYGNGSFK